MNSALPEMLHCLSNNSGNIEMSVLERQLARLKWQQQQLIQQQPFTSFDENDPLGGVLLIGNHDPGLGELMVSRVMKPDPDTENGWNDDFGRVFNSGNRPEFEKSCAIPRTALCSATGRESFKKRKADDTKNLKVVAEEKSMEKKVKGCTEEESNITEHKSNSKGTTTTTTATKNNNQKGPSKENSKGSEVPKPDYIHVRARRGEATDSHSLAERVRREKISERMKYLQDLVPGCNKISGKAGMLDEIINYVQSLQRQVEFLSMKLAAINPRLDFGMDNYLAKEMFPSCASSIPMMGVSSDTVNPDHLEFNALAQGVSSSGLEMGVNSPDITLRRTISAPVSIPGTLLDSSCLNQIQQLSWDAELQNLYNVEYQHGRSASFISQSFTGFVEAGHVKLEM